MDSRTQERVEQWGSRPFSGGYDGLADLATSEFSGAITAGGTWAFMLNGRIIGVVDGGIEDFETASGTRYDAPHPSLPLLCSMEARGGETRGKYYTNETPLREVDQTLQKGSFTGYIELSENVLSGDYYAVYYGGRRMAAAYIGNANRLITGDDAFDRADDEVGIYEVVTVDIEVTDVPGTDASETDPQSGSTDATETPAGPTTADSDDAVSGPDSTESVTALGSGSDEDESVTALGSGSDEDESITALGSGSDDDESITALGSGSDDTDEPGTASGSGDDDNESIAALGDGTEPEADETQASIETIADVVSSAEVAEIDDSTEASDEVDLTGEPSGITTTAESEPEPQSPGITDADSALTPTDDDESEPLQPKSSIADPAETALEEDPASRLDPDEVEAAVDTLDQNEISWTEDEHDSSTGDEESIGSGGRSGPAEADVSGSSQESVPRLQSTRTIPSIDPENTETPDSPSAERQSAGNPRVDTDETSAAEPATGTGHARPDRSSRPAREARSQSTAAEVKRVRANARKRIEELSERLETATEQRDTLREKAVALKDERDQFRSKNQELVSTIERLQSQIDDLEAELERTRVAAAEASADADADDGSGVDAGTTLRPQQALSDTNLFVRYGSKSQPTLDTAHDGEADRNEVATNLRLEHHTGFDAADVAVNDMPYDEFLRSTMAYQFVEWLTEVLLYEIRDTDHASALGDLYDAIPRIDRIELNASISLADDDTEDVPDEVTFDVVAYDKMGNPLVVTNLNDARSPATREMLESIEASASDVKANYPALAAAIVVTSSYFEPGALEVAETATSTGLLSRGSKVSYVNLSRKTGYHLCLVESRSEGFHMNVPEL